MQRLMILLVAVASALALTGAAFASPGPDHSVTGGGTFFTSLFPGDRVTVALTARTLPDGSPQGRFTLVHHLPKGPVFARFSGDVTCLTVVGQTAFTSGVITQGETELAHDVDLTGETVAMTIVDGNGADLFALDASFLGSHTIPPCQPGVLLETMDTGNFVVRGG
jgi:hypothetical protein